MILFFYQKHGPMINARTYCKFQGINASLNTGEEKKNARRDSGGLVCYIKNNIIKGIDNINWDFEDGLCFKLNKNFFYFRR